MLAAGASRRFGADKLLAPVRLGGRAQPLVAHALLPWLAVFARVTLVVRPEHDRLRLQTEASLGSDFACRLDWVICAEAECGMGRSLASGIEFSQDAAGWLIGLADMPCVPAPVIARVRNALVDGALLAAPIYRNMRGHPVGFAASHREELLALDGDSGARRLLERDPAMLRRIDTDDAGVLTDIDTPADLLTMTKLQ